MLKPNCSVEDCDRPSFCRDMCRLHYSRWRKANGPECSVEGCATIRYARDMCATHYTRWLKHGDPLIVLPDPKAGRKELVGCSVDDCAEPHMAKGLCQRHYGAARYAADPARFIALEALRREDPEFKARALARWQARRDADPEFIRARAAGYYVRHREVRLTDARHYRATHKEIVRAATSRYRALRRGAAINDFTAAQWREMKVRFGQRCAYCGVEPKVLTQDHVIPLARRGNHTAANIVPACQPCNSRKRTGPAPPLHRDFV